MSEIASFAQKRFLGHWWPSGFTRVDIRFGACDGTREAARIGRSPTNAFPCAA